MVYYLEAQIVINAHQLLQAREELGPQKGRGKESGGAAANVLTNVGEAKGHTTQIKRPQNTSVGL